MLESTGEEVYECIIMQLFVFEGLLMTRHMSGHARHGGLRTEKELVNGECCTVHRVLNTVGPITTDR